MSNFIHRTKNPTTGEEDSTPERRVMIAIANARLAVLRQDQGAP